MGDYIDDVEPGQIVVIDNDGRMDATVWGDILTLVADRKKIGGTVIDGVCRDIDRSIELTIQFTPAPTRCAPAGPGHG